MSIGNEGSPSALASGWGKSRLKYAKLSSTVDLEATESERNIVCFFSHHSSLFYCFLTNFVTWLLEIWCLIWYPIEKFDTTLKSSTAQKLFQFSRYQQYFKRILKIFNHFWRLKVQTANCLKKRWSFYSFLHFLPFRTILAVEFLILCSLGKNSAILGLVAPL